MGGNPDIDIALVEEAKRQTVDVPTKEVNATKTSFPLYFDGESISGKVFFKDYLIGGDR